MGQGRHVGLDLEGLEDSHCRCVGSAVAQPEIYLFSSQVVDRLDVASGQDMKLLIIKLRDVSQVFFDAWKRWITLDFVEHIGLHDAKIDTASKHDILGILQCPGPGDRQKPQAGLFTRECERQIDRIVGPLGHDADKSGVDLVAHRVAQRRCALLAARSRFRVVLGIGVNRGSGKQTTESR